MAYCILKSYRFNGDCLLLFNALKDQAYPFFLDSNLNSNPLGRYSFLGCNPFYVLETKGTDPFAELRRLLDRYRIRPLNKISPFSAGAVGYLAYDLGFALEKKLSRRVRDDLSIPDCLFGFYDTVIIYDHLKKTLFLLSSGLPETKYSLAKIRAQTRLKETISLISQTRVNKRQKTPHKKHSCGTSIKSNFSIEEYIRAIKKAKEYIKKGDIYQVNLSQRFMSGTRCAGYEIYSRLRNLSPSFFSAYLDCGDFQIISSSPERFLKLKGRDVYTRPMKGTRPRSKDKSQDQMLKRELLESAKDKAELIMIVDLERNDLGRVCNYGSVKIKSLRELEEYNTVFQTTATIKGLLHKDRDRIDLIKACFPGGSITGCPKIRAMEIIEELEPTRRCIYTGSLGYLSFCGNMDLNILIRTIIKKQDKIYFQVGGGIVADSKPDDEYQETLVKAKAMIEAVS
jgi:para-aminobenzoate synthetase component 1